MAGFEEFGDEENYFVGHHTDAVIFELNSLQNQLKGNFISSFLAYTQNSFLCTPRLFHRLFVLPPQV